MILLEIPEVKRKIYLPEDLSECDGQQYADACLLIYQYQKGKLQYEDLRIELLYRLLNLKKGKRKITNEQKEEMHSNIFALSAMLDSFFEKDEDGNLVIKQYYIKNHSPIIRDAFKKWYGPADEFNDITFGQYIDALNIYSLLERQPTTDLLYNLMAIFYHEKAQKYDPKNVSSKVKHFRYLHFGRVYGFFLLFASFQKYLFTAKVFYQGNELDLSILFKKDDKTTENDIEESKIPGLGMLSIAHQLAESGVHGSIKQVRDTDFWEIMLSLYDVRKRDLDHKAQKQREETKAKSKSK